MKFSIKNSNVNVPFRIDIKWSKNEPQTEKGLNVVLSICLDVNDINEIRLYKKVTLYCMIY